MEMLRGQSPRDAIPSGSGRPLGLRACQLGLRSRPAYQATSAQRGLLGQRMSPFAIVSVACHASQGGPSQLSTSSSTTITVQTAASPVTLGDANPAIITPSAALSQQPAAGTLRSGPVTPTTAIATTTAAAAAVPGAGAGSVGGPSVLPANDPLHRSCERVRRLMSLVETRRLYRNCIRAQYLLNLASPLYTPPPPPPPQEPAETEAHSAVLEAVSVSSPEDGDAERSLTSSASGLGSSASSSSSGSSSPSGGGNTSGLGSGATGGGLLRGPSPEEDKTLKAALETIAEMTLVSEQLKASLRFLPPGFGGDVFRPAAAASDEEQVREVARQYAAGLRERVVAELPLLPISSEAALHYIDSRNAKYSRRVALDELQGAGGGGVQGGGSGGGASSGASVSDLGTSGRASAFERLEAAERVAGEIIANSIKPALKKASEQDLVEVVRGTGAYLKGLWARLNGGAPAGARGRAALAGLDLPLPDRGGSQEQSELAISQLSLDLEALEKRLQEASKKRENKLRKAGLQGRVQMAIQLKGLDAEVLHLSSLLAVRTLQLEMEHVYGSLEAEALDIFNGLQAGGLLARDGSTNELALLVAEFGWLDEQLTLLAAALEGGEGAPGAAPGAPVSHGAPVGAAESTAAAAVVMGPALINDEVLGKLAAEIPDMRSRVGVADQTVFGGPGFSLTKARLQIRESLDKVKEAVTFLTRGVKLLGSDVATAARLFLKAAMGNTLKPREVSALRRTARDLLTFIPFTIILIIPLSPLGHVLVFGFIQRYFPSFFPSQFSSRRQEIMVRYEELERQLLEAQATAEAAEEEVELARAREAVARLTAPEPFPLGTASAAVAVVADAAAAAAGGAARNGAGAAGGGGGGGDGAVLAEQGGAGLASTAEEGPGAAAAVAATGAGRPGGGSGNGSVGVLDGAGAGGGRVSAAVSPLSSMGAGTSSMTSSVDEVTLHQATQKVRILAEQLDEIRDDVHMGEVAAEWPEAHMEGGAGSSSSLLSKGGGGGGKGTSASHPSGRRR